ncbi:MAG: hypothetical protein KC492_41365 [Myxococcales bacterium]|nr:hypothetical protein [Myxococcales bacterium]
MIVNLGNVKAAHKRFLAANERMVTTIMDRTATFAVDYVHQHPTFTRRTGKLQDKTKARVMRTAGGKLLRISNSAKYAKAIELGSKAHLIEARRKKFLRFKIAGKWVFARRVKHPGTKPHKFLWRSLWASGRIVDANLRQDMARIASQF